MNKFLEVMGKHKGKTAFVVFRENGSFRTSVHGKLTEVDDAGIMVERLPGAYALINHKNIAFILDTGGCEIFNEKDLGPKTKTK